MSGFVTWHGCLFKDFHGLDAALHAIRAPWRQRDPVGHGLVSFRVALVKTSGELLALDPEVPEVLFGLTVAVMSGSTADLQVRGWYAHDNKRNRNPFGWFPCDSYGRGRGEQQFAPLGADGVDGDPVVRGSRAILEN